MSNLPQYRLSGIGDLSDVAITSVTDNEVLQFISGEWINRTLAEAGIVAVGSNISQLVNDAGYISSVTGDWTGTFDGLEGAAYGQLAGTQTFTGDKTFSGALIGNLTGNADTATTATNVSTANEASDTTCFPLFVTASGTQQLQPKNNTGFTFSATTAQLGVGSLNVFASTVPITGIYRPAANTLGFSAGTALEAQLTSTAFSPGASDGNALGTSALMWSDLFLADGAVINFNNGNYTLTHSAGALAASGTLTASNLSGNNSGDQTSIVGITGTKAEFDTAVTDGNILYVGDVTQYTDEMAQDAVGAMVDSTLVYTDSTPLLVRAALTGDITASAGSNATTLATVNSNAGSFGSSTSIPSFTVNAKGLITAASGNAVIAPAGTLTGATLAAGVTASSLTSVGTIVTGVWNGTDIAVADGGTGASTAAGARTNLGLDAGGAGDIWVEKAGDTMTGALLIDGSSDVVQHTVQANGTQTSLLAVWENSAGADLITFSGLGGAVFNESGADADFRIEGDTNQNLFFVDASTDRIGIGTSAPTAILEVLGMTTADATYNHTMRLGDDTAMAAGVGGVMLFSGRADGSVAQYYGGYLRAAKTNNTSGNYSFDFVIASRLNGVAPSEALRITDVKNVKIAGSALRSTTEGTNQLVLFNGTAPVGTLSNGISLFSASGKLKSADAAGTVGHVLSGSAVNSVSPTAPNRTITVDIGGTTYYISAKTTND